LTKSSNSNFKSVTDLKDILNFSMKFNVLDFFVYMTKGWAFAITWSTFRVNVNTKFLWTNILWRRHHYKHKQDYLQMFATYKDNLYKYWNIKVYYRLNAFWDKIYTSLYIEGNVLNGSLKFTKLSNFAPNANCFSNGTVHILIFWKKLDSLCTILAILFRLFGFIAP
jgi:hypothetical protein